MSRTYACDACQHEQDTIARCLRCGVEGLVLVESSEDDEAEETAATYTAAPLGSAKRLELRPVRAPLLACVGHAIPKIGAVVVVAGKGGIGKSTEAARVALELGGAIWCDREMHEEQVSATFALAGASSREVERVIRVTAPNVAGLLAALEEHEAPLVVVDSLHEWAETDAERARLLRALRPLATRGVLVLALAHVNAKGKTRGAVVSEHLVDCVIYVTERFTRQSKCRWHPPAKVKRASVSKGTKRARRVPRSPQGQDSTRRAKGSGGRKASARRATPRAVRRAPPRCPSRD